MEIRLSEQKLNEHMLRDVAVAGDVNALYDLIAQDLLLLKRIDETPFIDTPLHIAALRGNADFAMEIVNLMPSYARKLNQNGASPLHLAVESENISIVDCLIRNDKDLVRVKGRHGMSPLFHAVLKGNIDIVVKFLLECPECVIDENHPGETSAYFALVNRKFEVFRVLVGWLRRSTHKDARDWEDRVLNAKDRDQNTLLHIAAYNGEPWVVNLLFTSKLVDISTKNKLGLTARDVAKSNHQKEISDVLWWPAHVRSFIPAVSPLMKKLRSNMTHWDIIKVHVKRERESISNETRDALLVVFVLVVTANYQAALSPPGGLWQGNASSNSPPSIFNHQRVGTFGHNSAEAPSQVGTIVVNMESFEVIWWLNTVTLVTSFIMILFMFPTGSRRLLLLPLCLMAADYAVSMSVISQDNDWYVRNMAWFFPLLALIYFLSWLGPIKEMIDRRYQREWGSYDIM